MAEGSCGRGEMEVKAPSNHALEDHRGPIFESKTSHWCNEVSDTQRRIAIDVSLR